MTTASLLALSFWLAILCAISAPSMASNDAELAAFVRRFDQLDRDIHTASTAPQETNRYHFDFARLQDDIARVRAGINDYLTPQRAQPRDPVPLSGDYRRDSFNSEVTP